MGFKYIQELSILDSLTDGLLVQTVPNGGVVHVNAGFLNLLLCDRSHLDHRPDSWIDQVYHDDRDLLHHWWQQLLQQPTAAEQTYRILQPDGAMRWVQCRSLQVKAEPEASVCLATLHVDVTSQRQGCRASQPPVGYLQRLFDQFLLGVCCCDAAGRILWTNDAFPQLLGYSPHDLIGRPFQGVISPSCQGQLSPDWVQARQPWSEELELLTGQQQHRWMLTTVAPLPPGPGQGATAVCLIQDIHRRKQAEGDLRAALQDTAVLIAEIHHRVKNNLQIISSLLELQANRTQDARAKTTLLASQDRVLAMSLIHETLYQSDNIAQINFEAYVQHLVSGLARAYVGDHQLDFDLQIDAATIVSTDLAVPLGLILNELVTNALKHSPGALRGVLTIGLHPLADQQYRLSVSQTTGRLPADFSIDQTTSMGLQIVKLLTHKIGATLHIQHQPTTFEIVFSRDP